MTGPSARPFARKGRHAPVRIMARDAEPLPPPPLHTLARTGDRAMAAPPPPRLPLVGRPRRRPQPPLVALDDPRYPQPRAHHTHTTPHPLPTPPQHTPPPTSTPNS